MPQPRDYDDERGPVQVIYPKDHHGFFWKVLAGVAGSLVTMAIGFIGGATWSHNTRITALEVNRVNDKESQDKLERRVDSIESRIK
jgi:hypothetical protein